VRLFPKFPTPDPKPAPTVQVGAPADTGSVLGVLTAEVQRRFGHTPEGLKQLVDAAPEQVPGGREVLHWYGLLTDAQEALEAAEHALMGVVDQGSGPLTENQMALAVRVDAAVTVRDNRAQVLRYLLDPDAAGKRGPVAGREALGVRRPSALSTSVPPPRPTAAPSARGVGR
jgi:hypothetical protein